MKTLRWIYSGLKSLAMGLRPLAKASFGARVYSLPANVESAKKGDGKKLNVGCGTEALKGFVNIDGSDELPSIDLIVQVGEDDLTAHFDTNSVDYILAQDIIEHVHHWEATKVITQFYELLKGGAHVEIRVPDCEFIVGTGLFPIEKKLNLIFGGQDIPQGRDAEMDRSRKEYPEFFSHRYGWTRASLVRELRNIGFKSVTGHSSGTNIIVVGTK